MFLFSVKTFDHPNTIYARLPRELSTTRPSDTIKWALVNQDGDIEKNPDGTESLEHGEDSHEPEEAHDQARILSQVDRLDEYKMNNNPGVVPEEDNHPHHHQFMKHLRSLHHGEDLHEPEEAHDQARILSQVDRLDEHKINNDHGAEPKQDDNPHYHVKMTLLRSLHHGGDSHESEEYKLAEERGQNEWQNNDENEEWDQTEGNNENDEKDLYQVRNLDQDMGSSEENDDDKN